MIGRVTPKMTGRSSKYSAAPTTASNWSPVATSLMIACRPLSSTSFKISSKTSKTSCPSRSPSTNGEVGTSIWTVLRPNLAISSKSDDVYHVVTSLSSISFPPVAQSAGTKSPANDTDRIGSPSFLGDRISRSGPQLNLARPLISQPYGVESLLGVASYTRSTTNSNNANVSDAVVFLPTYCSLIAFASLIGYARSGIPANSPMLAGNSRQPYV
mmetsp:Transcript_4738/g.12055  ORF Transcript_4738/g.12055 Transcript_4738/m.12055 type:complete len:214 (+) Transcript_4738:727-1368(+)